MQPCLRLINVPVFGIGEGVSVWRIVVSAVLGVSTIQNGAYA